MKTPKLLLSRHLTVAAFVSVLTGCGQSGEDIESRIGSLESLVEKQSRQLAQLQEVHDSHRSALDWLSQWEDVTFHVDDVRFDIVEKAFEPLIIGDAQLKLGGEAPPALIFVEWTLTVIYKGEALAPAVYTQRVENGASTLKIIHPLPSHGIKKQDISLQVTPTGWYMAHVAELAE